MTKIIKVDKHQNIFPKYNVIDLSLVAFNNF